MRIEPMTTEFEEAWDAYVISHPRATFYHRARWREVISNATGHKSEYRLALEGDRVAGVLPLFVLSTRLFGKMAVSLPFLNAGGIVADSPEAENVLAEESRRIGDGAGCRFVELRQRFPTSLALPVSDRKVTSLISLEGGREKVFGRLHQNVRNKIRKAAKEGVAVDIGPEHLGDFYRVYSHNLRDLGTPVLHRKFFENILAEFPKEARVLRATHRGRTIGAKLILMDRDICYFVWAAALRKELPHAPVHALNWAAIEMACDAGCANVDLGRSSAESSQQDFKKYWGVTVAPLPWTYQLLACEEMPGLNPDNPKFRLAIRLWRTLPVFLSRLIGPPLARLLP
jgi:FemAB-related protein (PEP-CTERM system-associated)